ncbi:TAF6-like RNA polymerase II p300/CBP-associated factor-associated factor 65 kDa subunit 6L [Varroa jacobsoni]|uniref:Transcription initiation factor TFIID subunit 6 n=1 Tax=Varroa destructor TaxID=109461 RepID=A0A7M7J8C5_VARDE|nr:TAF6-like RNA polymerase II p300/CBP-associated factor-associated factor 65 kDa subunit 6L [Varroa destructor]XP_022648153.1 TAF6-like RNA polymerase II p300/CBP-associated factor-associated factor 65 kDa subunit 6L [Varroa destructor]XP_022648154.1 TAF6-like RNA polymerase II p300/CBP-associated factor-associated factor 65 kDa subunit 6L [Varroa destructor]XP_022703897.1 TAF6-like RNA polymerase II p300/CBP-associated factor-associated factor 65 kDa subunit 6L [Varroa jacobsoni]
MQPQQFVLLGTTSVERWSEQLDLSLDADALTILTEDLNFRLRQLAHDASQHMRHSGRRRITPNDIDRALQWCNFGPSCGLGCRTSTEQTDYVQIDDMSVPIFKSIEVENALDVRLDLDVEPVLPACLSQWALVDGRAQPGVEIEYPEGQRKLDAFTSVHSEYLEQAVQAIMSDSDEATALIMDDLASNPNLAVLLPSLLNSISVGLRQYHHDPPRMFRLLGAFKALVNNDYLLMTSSASLQACLQILYYCLRESLAMEATETTDELTFRMKAAYVMQFFVEMNSNSTNRLEEEVTARCMNDCLTGNIDAMYGALFTLRLLGKGRLVLKELPALIAVIEPLEQLPAASAKACLARGFLHEFARQEIVQAQTAILHNERYEVDYSAIEQYLGPSIAAMLHPLSIGEFLFRPARSSPLAENDNSSDQLLGSFYEDSTQTVHSGSPKKQPRLKPSSSILRSQLIKRSPNAPCSSIYEAFEMSRLCGQRIRFNYGQPVVTMERPKPVTLHEVHAKTRAKFAAIVAKQHGLTPNKRLMMNRERRSWSAIMRSACVALVL